MTDSVPVAELLALLERLKSRTHQAHDTTLLHDHAPALLDAYEERERLKAALASLTALHAALDAEYDKAAEERERLREVEEVLRTLRNAHGQLILKDWKRQWLARADRVLGELDALRASAAGGEETVADALLRLARENPTEDLPDDADDDL